MSIFTLVAVLLALGVCFVPVWLLRRPDWGRAQDYFACSQATRPQVVRNASIAYALRMGTLGPLFAWGASGDPWPAIVASACLGLGVYLIYVLREPLLEFLDEALGRDGSITVHELIARQHGNDPRVRRLAASLTLLALLALLAGEALALAALLEAMLPESATFVHLLLFAALLSMVLNTVLAGHSGVMHSAQLQLGLIYLGLFGAAALLLYLHVSALRPMPPHGTLAVVVAAVCCTIMLHYRRSRYVDTAPIRIDRIRIDPVRIASSGADPGRASPGARALGRFAKILNACLSTLLVLSIVVAAMSLYAAGPAAIVRDSAAALRAGTGASGVALLALCLLPLFHPLVDVTNWQRLAAARTDTRPRSVDPNRRKAELREVLAMYAVESALVWLFIGALGAIAVIAIEAPAGADVLQLLATRLVSPDNGVSVALPLLLICVLAIALSTMTALFSACLCTIRYDLLAALWPELAPGREHPSTEPVRGREHPSTEATARRRTLTAGSGILVVFAVAFFAADAFLPIRFPSSAFLALLSALCCLQLSFVPLVVGPMVARLRRSTGAVSPGWAAAVLGAGAASTVAGVAAYLATGTEAWLWAAVPACLGSGLLLFAVARTLSRERTP